MAIITTPAAGVSPYQSAAAAPAVLRAAADGTTVLATAATATVSELAAANANTLVVVSGQAALNSLITSGQPGVFDGANVTINLEEQNFTTTNQVTSTTNYPSGSTGEIQYNSGSNSFASDAFFTYTSGNVVTPGIRTDGYFYANGAPFISGGNAAIGNFVFNGDNMTIAHANSTLSVTGNGTGGINLTANGNVTIAANTNSYYQWLFDTTGNIVTTAGYSKIIQNPNGGIALWTPGGSATAQPSINYGTTSTLAVGPNITLGTGSGNNTWTFGANGNLTLPANTFAVNYANGNPVVISSNAAGLPLANGTSNINIATANGNVTITSNGNTWNFDTTGDLTAPGNITANNLVINSITSDDSSFVTVEDGLNVTSGLISAPGNILLTAGSSTWAFDNTGTLTVPGDIVSANLIGTGSVSAAGNVFGNNINANYNLSAFGNVYANSAILTFLASTANLQVSGTANVGSLSTVGSVSANGNITSLSAIYSGNGATWQTQVALANVLFVGADVADEYVQAAMVETGGNGSADWVSYSNNGNTDSGWIDMGMTGNTFNDPNYELTDPNDGYILVQGTNVSGTPLGGNLVLATGDIGLTHDIVFATGGFTHANIKARLIDTTGEFSVVGNIAANNLSGTNLVINSISSDDSTFVTIEDGVDVNGEISATGNITGNYFIGNGSQLTSVAVPSQTILPTIQTITATARPAGLFGGGQGGANVTVANTISVTEYGVIITSGTVSQTYATGALGSIPGTVSLTFSTGLNSTQYTLYAYVTSNAGTYYSDAVTGTSGICLLAGTQIALSDGTHKAIEDITYTDKLLSWDFDRGCYAETTAMWIKRSETGSQYNLLTFSDGTTLRTFDQHRIFNKQAGAFTYPMTDATPVGTVTVNDHGQEITLTNKQVIKDTIEYYNVITDYHMNLFSDSVLTSCRFNNIYPITDMKFVKDARTLRTRAEFENVPDRFFHGLRLAEQTTDIETVEWYVNRLLSTEVSTHAELAV